MAGSKQRTRPNHGRHLNVFPRGENCKIGTLLITHKFFFYSARNYLMFNLLFVFFFEKSLIYNIIIVLLFNFFLGAVALPLTHPPVDAYGPNYIP